MLLDMRSVMHPGDAHGPLWVSPTVRWSSVGVALALTAVSVFAGSWRQLSGDIAGSFVAHRDDTAVDRPTRPPDRTAA